MGTGGVIGKQITILITPLLLVILGITIRFGKASWLIAGYNTASKSEKAKYNELELCKSVGNLMFILAGVFLFITVIAILNPDYFNTIVIIGALLVFPIIIAAVIYMNTSKKFKKS